MCGRYAASDGKAIQLHFPLIHFPNNLRPRYNIAPSQDVLIAKNDGLMRASYARWGLVPSWASSPDTLKVQPINARVETLAESRMFAPLLKKKRCLIFADAFFEWKLHEGKKIPYCFRRQENLPFAFAGLWDSWGSEIDSCTIITGPPNALVAPIHNRMPVMLNADAATAWLNDQDVQQLFDLLQPYSADEMYAYPVSSALNKPSFDQPPALEPQQLQ